MPPHHNSCQSCTHLLLYKYEIDMDMKGLFNSSQRCTFLILSAVNTSWSEGAMVPLLSLLTSISSISISQKASYISTCIYTYKKVYIYIQESMVVCAYACRAYVRTHVRMQGIYLTSYTHTHSDLLAELKWGSVYLFEFLRPDGFLLSPAKILS